MEPHIFKSETIYDLPVHREFCKAAREASTPHTIFSLVFVAALVILIGSFESPVSLYGFLTVAGISLVAILYQAYSNQHGDLQYKRILRNNGGKTPHQILTFCENGIHILNRDTKKQLDYAYDQILSIAETKHLLLLYMEHHLCLITDKRWLKGGTREEFIMFLHARCPNLRQKHKNVKLGKLVRWFSLSILCVGTLLALTHFTVPAESGGKMNGMTYAEIATELEKLGITCEDETFLEEMDQYTDDLEYDKVLGLLCYLGFGEYDEKTWEWTPSECGVYWFDAEVLNVDTMYSDFLLGVSALGDGELDFTNVLEDYSAVDWEHGTGTVNISFDWQGCTYSMNAQMMNDWFDVSVMETMCDIIGRKSDKNLYYAYDGGQGYLLFFGDSQWAKEFERVTGINIDNN